MNLSPAEITNAACCLWEALLDLRDDMPDLDGVFHDYGHREIRFACHHMAHIVLREFHVLPSSEAQSLDWDFTPHWLREKGADYIRNTVHSVNAPEH